MKTRPSLLDYAASLFIVVLGAACSQSSTHPTALGDCTSLAGQQACSGGAVAGSGGDSSGDGGLCGDFQSSIATCQSCLDTSCCSQNGACTGITACRALGSCIPYCTTQTCIDDCNRQYADGVAAYGALNNCASNSCTAACSASGTQPDAGAQCGTITSSVAACQTCLDASCCSENQVCSQDAACPSVLACGQACAANNTACVNACRAQSTSGAAALDAFTACASAKCPACK